MLLEGDPRRKDQSFRIEPPCRSFFFQVACSSFTIFQQPQDTSFNFEKQSHPTVEHLRENLIIVIETAEHETAFRQAAFLAIEKLRANFLASIIGLIAIWQVNPRGLRADLR
jgi:hypothetical protein